MTTYRVRGLDELRAKFLAFPEKLQKQALDTALAKGAAPIREAAQVYAPKDTGAMAAAIVTVKDKKPKIDGMDARYIVMVKYNGKEAADYWRFVEFGTSKQPPQPFMRPAFEAQKTTALALVIESIVAAIPRIAGSKN